MEHQLSTSIKISGVPLLPPLVTSNILTEIQYYKKLAVAVEERLKILEIAKEVLEKNKSKPAKFDYSGVANFKEQNECVTDTKISLMTDFPIQEHNQNLIDIDGPVTDNSKIDLLTNDDFNLESKRNKLDQLNKSDEDKSCSNDTVLAESISSDAVTASTDLNQYLNVSSSSKTDTVETTETTPENWKPQVPKTLDIVPITLDQSKPTDKLSSDSDNTPKLVRQGSYVLDAPSPVLLAHMQNDTSNSENSPTSSSQSIKRKEWSTSKTKLDWKNQCNFTAPTLPHKSSVNKFNKNSAAFNQRISKSVSNSKSSSPLDVYQPAKSADCIQAMFVKECCSPKTVHKRANNHTKKLPSFNGTSSTKVNSVKKSSNNMSILNRADKLSCSLGSLSNNSPKPVRRIDKQNSRDLALSNDLNSTSSSLSNDNSSIPSQKQKPVIKPEKIISVFKEIQDTHKKQMLELMNRQQKEQMLIQENFKKQQILLLAQIRKAFPEISISALSEAICGRRVESNTPLGSRGSSEKSQSFQQDIEKPETIVAENLKKNEKNASNLAVNDHHLLQESSTTCHSSQQQNIHNISPSHSINSQATQTLDNVPPLFINRFDLSNVRDIDEVPVGNPIRRPSSVSRQLFPRDSKTNHFSVMDNFLYTEKHIKAATIINAHARGFLVRRLMKTEKVVALKNTYREALHCMLRLHVDAPLNLAELNFHNRLQLQCDAASMSIVELFSQSPIQRMEIIAHDREVKRARSDRPSSARSSYSFATQRTLARKKLKEMGAHQNFQSSIMTKSCPARTRCQTWGANSKDKRVTTSMINQGMKRSTSAGAVRKPWR